MFVNTLTADDQYSLLNRDNLKRPIRARLSEKQKAFFEFLVAIPKSALNFEHLQKKDDLHSRFISGITHSEKRG